MVLMTSAVEDESPWVSKNRRHLFSVLNALETGHWGSNYESPVFFSLALDSTIVSIPKGPTGMRRIRHTSGTWRCEWGRREKHSIGILVLQFS